MIIPIRCFTCGKVVADKYEHFLQESEKMKNEMTDKEKKSNVKPMFDDVFTNDILDKLGLNRYCCRRHMITTVDMMHII